MLRLSRYERNGCAINSQVKGREAVAVLVRFLLFLVRSRDALSLAEAIELLLCRDPQRLSPYSLQLCC